MTTSLNVDSRFCPIVICPPLFIEVPVPSQENIPSCICVLGVLILSPLILALDFWNSFDGILFSFYHELIERRVSYFIRVYSRDTIDILLKVVFNTHTSVSSNVLSRITGISLQVHYWESRIRGFHGQIYHRFKHILFAN